MVYWYTKNQMQYLTLFIHIIYLYTTFERSLLGKEAK